MTKAEIKLVQQYLKSKKLYYGKIDGIAGSKTEVALSKIKALNSEWNKTRKLIAALQLYCKENKIDVGKIDGLNGPQTKYAVNALIFKLENGKPEPVWRPDEIEEVNPNKWPSQDENSLNKFFGNPGENLVIIDLPYPLKLSWDKKTTVTKLKCNKKVKDSLQRIFSEVLKTYGLKKIQELELDVFGGCFNIRKKRNGTSLSTHSWAIALDFNPDKNQLKWGRDKAQFAKPEYEKWWKIWEKEGWVSLGRSRNFDWMHVQAAKI